MEEALTARILGSAPISGQIDGRFSWSERPAGEGVPALVAQVVADGIDYDHDGKVNLQYPRIQFDCYGATYLQAKALSRAVLSEMEKSQVVGAVTFDEGFLVSGMDMPKDKSDGGTEAFRVKLDIIVPFHPT